MEQVVLIIHMILAIAIIGLVLLQRSEGGGLGIGGGGMGGLATPQGAASAMTRVTWWCVAGFFVTSLTLGVMAGRGGSANSIMNRLDAPVAASSTMTPEAAAEAGETAPVAPAPSAPVAE